MNELKPYLELNDQIRAQADRRALYIQYGILGYMCSLWGILFRLTWWEYSWDIMEPITYFITYGYVVTRIYEFSNGISFQNIHWAVQFLYLHENCSRISSSWKAIQANVHSQVCCKTSRIQHWRFQWKNAKIGNFEWKSSSTSRSTSTSITDSTNSTSFNSRSLLIIFRLLSGFCPILFKCKIFYPFPKW